MKNATIIGAILCIGLLACAKEKANGTGPCGPAGNSASKLIPIGDHHLVFSPGSKSPTSLYILDWGQEDRPDIDLASPIAHFQMENDAQDLLLIGEGKPMVRFSVRPDVKGSAGELVVPVIGISALNDPAGFNMERISSATGDDAFARVNASRQGTPKTGGPVQPPIDNCCSGGPGATSCSTKGETYSCSVTCASGYYALL